MCFLDEKSLMIISAIFFSVFALGYEYIMFSPIEMVNRLVDKLFITHKNMCLPHIFMCFYVNVTLCYNLKTPFL